MPDSFKDKRDKTKPLSQVELDAQLLREKTARLRELRLAHEAANGPKPVPGAAVTRKPAGSGQSKSGQTKSGRAKSGANRGKSQSLADWLATQEDQGRRS